MNSINSLQMVWTGEGYAAECGAKCNAQRKRIKAKANMEGEEKGENIVFVEKSNEKDRKMAEN